MQSPTDQCQLLGICFVGTGDGFEGAKRTFRSVWSTVRSSCLVTVALGAVVLSDSAVQILAGRTCVETLTLAD